MGKKAATQQGPRVPKVKCCVSTERCMRCPIRLLAEGNMPEGFTVKKRRVVRVEPSVSSTKTPKASKPAKKITKSELEKAVKRTRRNRRALTAA